MVPVVPYADDEICPDPMISVYATRVFSDSGTESRMDSTRSNCSYQKAMISSARSCCPRAAPRAFMFVSMAPSANGSVYMSSCRTETPMLVRMG